MVMVMDILKEGITTLFARPVLFKLFKNEDAEKRGWDGVYVVVTFDHVG